MAMTCSRLPRRIFWMSSFCGKTQKQVKKLIAGPGVYIFDECIDLCNEIILDEKIDDLVDPLLRMDQFTEQEADVLKLVLDLGITAVEERGREVLPDCVSVRNSCGRPSRGCSGCCSGGSASSRLSAAFSIADNVPSAYTWRRI